MPAPRTLALAALLSLLALPAPAADFSDPTWPCIQRKVETLSLGLMWPEVIDAARLQGNKALQDDVAELADTLALRRIAVDDMRAPVEAFAARHDGDLAILGLVFDRVFTTLSKRRTRIIGGIGDFSLSQIALAEQIDAKRLEMDRILAATEPDFDRVDVLEEQIDWDQVIHSDRQRSIQYLCETPQLIEKRLFAVAQLLQQVAN